MNKCIPDSARRLCDIPHGEYVTVEDISYATCIDVANYILSQKKFASQQLNKKQKRIEQLEKELGNTAYIQKSHADRTIKQKVAHCVQQELLVVKYCGKKHNIQFIKDTFESLTKSINLL